MKPMLTNPLLADVHFEILGKLDQRARELTAQGRTIDYLNIGNVSRFGLHPDTSLQQAISNHLPDHDGYEHEQGLESARTAIAKQQRARGVQVDERRVFIGNGVSELIDFSLRALLQPDDEVLLPCPDYPLWSAATTLNSGKVRYYHCPASQQHLPDPEAMAALITPRTRAIVLVNPNNPTGAVYPRKTLEAIVELARQHGLLLFSDEIYDGITYEDTTFQPLAPLAGEVPCITYGGLSKVHCACGYRMGWMTLSGSEKSISDYRNLLQKLAAMRLGPNVPTQATITVALEGTPPIHTLTLPGNRLYQARQAVIDGVANSAFLQLIAPRGALYAYIAIKKESAPDFDDKAFALHLLEQESVLLTPGSSFNDPTGRHLRLTLLPEPDKLKSVMQRIERALHAMYSG